MVNFFSLLYKHKNQSDKMQEYLTLSEFQHVNGKK